MKRKLKKGDKVIIKDCEEIRNWSRGKECIGKTLTITSYYPTENTYICNNNEYGINFKYEMFGKYTWKDIIEQLEEQK